ncbi:sensor histidine kinase [Novosphingobium taihuense]|uniref:Signal transduction histidine kinase n=1 Tax=Novosphingobium taihuense TaxID=260085 RepID=A0A7W7A9H0_9SPHN|nr:histidine kinase [Novosphingobium taihuense]MBB4612165.1 signal transduction histidine kinase [Novosphingobium taihuense]TWH88481.1 signal transduction histidine kinase [Novosphingobium taihuense]
MARRNTGRVVAMGRAILALAFLLALWLDPSVPTRGAIYGYALLSSYALWTAALMVVAWRSWWFDFRLATLAQGLDIAMFLAAVYFTESRFTEFQSPFLALAAFLLVASMVRWNWRATVLTAVVLLSTNLIFGISLYKLGVDIDLFRFVRRTIYMILLSSMLIWLSMSRGSGRTVTLPDPSGIPGERRDMVFDAALALVSRCFGAGHVAFAFASSEEPWIELRRLDGSAITSSQLAPEDYAEELLAPRPAAVFDINRGRMLTHAQNDPSIICAEEALQSRLARALGADTGIIVSVQSVTGSGHLIAWDTEALSFDDIGLMAAVADELGRALDREEMARLARNAAETGVRHAVARDLHDSVAQFLAGTLFRLEALRRWIREGNDPEGEIDSIKNALRREQGQLRLLIERLRRGQESDRRTDIAEELNDLLTEAGAHWHIDTALVLPDYPLPISVQLSHEIRQLVREAVANAARHGKCRKVTVRVDNVSGQIRLSIVDDGMGFPPIEKAPRPRSITERVEALGGSFELHSSGDGARLEIALRSGEFA